MSLLQYFVSLWNTAFQPQPSKPVRRQLKDVKPGELIQIEWSRVKGRFGYLKCLNNDSGAKKIFLEVTWGNYKEAGIEPKEKLVLNYKSEELKNFHLLNSTIQPETFQKEDADVATLQKKMNEALEKEEYEIADQLQKKINKLLQKSK